MTDASGFPDSASYFAGGESVHPEELRITESRNTERTALMHLPGRRK
uniref:Uncharacterized protein n=1 Tax=Faecalibaculum rodentium TaxID=1702221 RepID=A0A140DUM6_9FIRM|nr:hypothetical protein AALO17_12190 [Faecalibaculum rodentium]